MRTVLFIVSILMVTSLAFAEQKKEMGSTGGGGGDSYSSTERSLGGEEDERMGRFGSEGKMSSDKVKEVQRALNQHGADLKVDAVMGSNTKQAIRDFQRENNLDVTARADQQTLDKLNIS